jgi:hypothetical protein
LLSFVLLISSLFSIGVFFCTVHLPDRCVMRAC